MTTDVPTADTKNLEEQLEILNRRLHKRTSPRYLFFYSLVQGIGQTLGATIVAGLVFFLVVQIVASIDYLPVINRFVSSEGVREVFRSFEQNLSR